MRPACHQGVAEPRYLNCFRSSALTPKGEILIINVKIEKGSARGSAVLQRDCGVQQPGGSHATTA